MAIFATGCGGSGATGGADPSATPRPGVAARKTSADACRKMLGSFVDSMADLRRKLAVGISYEDYLGEVQELRATYAAIPDDRLGLGCLLAAGTPGERALNRYMAAANDWGECLTTAGCETATVEPRLQREWARASVLLSTAQAGI
jgi:hypothetical protein